MNLNRKSLVFSLTSAILIATVTGAAFNMRGTSIAHAAPPPPPALAPTPVLSYFTDATGIYETISSNGTNRPNNPFFQPLGTNGRACVTCHQPDEGWTITPAAIQAKFNQSGGNDPLFRTVDGSNSPNANVSDYNHKLSAYSMLLSKGLIRVGLPVPAKAEFQLTAVADPYGFASAAQLSLFRRPLAATNLSFLSTVMWDGRAVGGSGIIHDDLTAQAINAVATHMQGKVQPSAAILSSIVGMESNLYTAQVWDSGASSLYGGGAMGGPIALTTAPFYPAINDVTGLDPTGKAFNPNVFTMYKAWSTTNNSTPTMQDQASVARGEQLFNNRQFAISGVAGLNDIAGVPVLPGTCASCHDTPSVGNHSIGDFLNIGIADASRRTPDMPLYTFRNIKTGTIVQTTDPGRALVTGSWVDIGKFKVPIMRGLAAQAPYFHNGSAHTINDVINFYDQRFNIGFSPQEEADLAAFLRTL